ncbi:MAG: prefoldin subunit beta [Candidatus Nezhaarchaeota archaeon]|nr:prefoldin subunit beta [Candidatus Nezhaarchaeota archaeon]
MQFQEIQERIKALLVRRQQLELELREIEKTLEELKGIDDATPVFKFAGRVLIKANRENVTKELVDRKETLELHIKTLEKQEAQARKRFEELRLDLSQSLSGFQTSG